MSHQPVNVGTIGHIDHGKSVLSSLIGAFLKRDASDAKPLPDFNAQGELRRSMEVSSFDADKRTVELAFSSEFEGMRWFGVEILDHDPNSIRLDRLRDGGALLVDHDWSDQVGVVESVTIGADRRGRAVVRFGRSERANEIFQDVVDGIRRHVSVGYRVHDAKLVETRDGVDVFRITDWEPLEISMVAVPFDHSVGIGRSLEKLREEADGLPPQNSNHRSGAATGENHFPEENRNMKIKILRDASGNLVRAEVDEAGSITKVLEVIEQAGEDVRAAELRATRTAEQRVTTLLELGEKYEGCRDLAAQFIREGKSVDEFRAAALDHMNTRGSKPAGNAKPRESKPLSDGQQRSAEIGLTDREARNYSLFNVVRALANPHDKKAQEAAAFEIECSQEAARVLGKEAKGLIVPEDVLARAFNAGGAANTPTGAITGQNLVDTQLMTGSFIEMLRNRTTIMRLAATMGGLVGNVEIPKQTGGATAYWIGEGQDATEGTPVIGQLGLSPKTVAAYTDITRRLLMQSTPDAEGIVRRDLVAAIGQAIDKAGYYGSGTANQPLGIKNVTGINAVDFAAVQPTFAELVQMESEIAADNADVNSMAYVMNAVGRGAAKTTAKFSGGTDQGTIWEPGNTINGYRAEITNQLTTGDVFFGNFNDLIVGLWGGLDLTVDPYSLSKSGGLRIVVFQDVDFAVRRVESFCYGSATVTP